jgi:hypothetical protein
MGKEIKESSKETNSFVITNIITGKITRKYRMASSLEKITGINRKFVDDVGVHGKMLPLIYGR